MDELEKELDGVVVKVKNELRKANSRIAEVENKHRIAEIREKKAFEEIIELQKQEIARLNGFEKDQPRLLEKIERLTGLHQTQNEKIRDLVNRLEESESSRNHLENACHKAENDNRSLMEKNVTLKEANQSLEEENTLLSRSLHAIKEYKQREHKISKELEKATKELVYKSEVLERKNCEMTALKTHIQEGNVYIEKLQKRIDDEATQKTKDDLQHKQILNDLQSRIQDMTERKSKDDKEHANYVKELLVVVDEERKRVYNLSYRYSQLVETNNTQDIDQENDAKVHQVLREDKKQQTGGAYLRDLEINPQVIQVQHLMLYDNEWTDAFDDLNKGDEEQKVTFLLTLLMHADELCRNAATEYVRAIKHSACYLTISSQFQERQEAVTTMEGFGDEVPGKRASDLKRTSKSKKSYVKVEETKPAKLERIIKCNLINGEEICIDDICEYMQSKLSEDLVKTGAELIATVNKIDPQKQKPLLIYIEKCIDICWSMHRHVPSLYLKFPSEISGCLFDARIYKPYTSLGEYVHYIVWPALYQHENGPLLSQGVAQFRN